MNPHIDTATFIKHDDDLLVFIFFDENERRSKYNREIDHYIQMLATINCTSLSQSGTASTPSNPCKPG